MTNNNTAQLENFRNLSKKDNQSKVGKIDKDKQTLEHVETLNTGKIFKAQQINPTKQRVKGRPRKEISVKNPSNYLASKGKRKKIELPPIALRTVPNKPLQIGTRISTVLLNREARQRKKRAKRLLYMGHASSSKTTHSKTSLM